LTDRGKRESSPQAKKIIKRSDLLPVTDGTHQTKSIEPVSRSPVPKSSFKSDNRPKSRPSPLTKGMAKTARLSRQGNHSQSESVLSEFRSVTRKVKPKQQRKNDLRLYKGEPIHGK
jgi:hypothetical protein